ncbi:hypothetical protein L3Q82_023456, partial [Scortum barcoo]
PLLRTFYETVVVASVVSYAVVCWGGGCSERDKKRLNRLIKRASSVCGCLLDSIEVMGERRALAKLSTIMDNTSHPLHQTVGALSSSFSNRLRNPRYAMVNGGDFSKLTRKHGVKVCAGSPCSVEEVAFGCWRADRTWLRKISCSDEQRCCSVCGEGGAGEPAGADRYHRELSRHGKVVSPIKKVLSGCKSPLLKHVVSHRRQLFMILNNRNEEFNCRFHTKKMALANLLDTKVQGALVRSRVQNITEMDAPSSFFFGMEKKHGQRKYIHSLLSDTGQELTEPGEIRGASYCPLSTQELHAALQSMQGRKAPGIDGLTVEFYKAFWDILAGDLLEVFNESLASGLLPLSCRRAVITILPKKVLANRLKRAMEQIIHRDQTYCVPGWQSVFKSWALFNHERSVKRVSLYWLLNEPLICGARLDVCGSTVPGLMGALCRTRAVCLKQLVGCSRTKALTDAQAVSSVLGVRSVRLVERGLELWRQRLSEKERTILNRYGKGEVEPDHKDTFPEVHLSPDFKDLNGPLLTVYGTEKLSLHKADKQTFYRNCVKTIHRKGLCNRAPSVWTGRLSGMNPQWRTLYKPPLKKRTGDLQWRVLHERLKVLKSSDKDHMATG